MAAWGGFKSRGRLPGGHVNGAEGQTLRAFLAPRYWPLLAGLGLLRGLSWLPYPLLTGLGWGAGRLMQALLHRRRHAAEVNLALCFPELDESARRRLLREHFTSLGIGVFDYALAMWASDRRVQRLVQLEGLENLLKPVREGRGVILLSGHLPAIELTGRALALQVPDMAAIYRPHKNPLIHELMRRGRSRSVRRQIPKRDMRQMLRLLKQGGVPVWYASDQSFRGKGAILVPFFGVPAMTNPALSQLARIGDTVVVPYLTRRLPRARGYVARILPPLEDFPSGDPAADALRVHRLLEEHIREAPAQYYWIHRRFKDRPAELGNPYEQ